MHNYIHGVNTSELWERWIANIHQLSILLVPFCSWELQQVINMSLQNGANLVLHSFQPEIDDQSFLASVAWRAEWATGDLLPCDKFVDRNLDNFYGSSFDVGQYKKRLMNKKCRLRAD